MTGHKIEPLDFEMKSENINHEMDIYFHECKIVLRTPAHLNLLFECVCVCVCVSVYVFVCVCVCMFILTVGRAALTLL